MGKSWEKHDTEEPIIVTDVIITIDSCILSIVYFRGFSNWRQMKIVYEGGAYFRKMEQKSRELVDEWVWWSQTER